MATDILLTIGGLAVLILSAEFLIVSATRLSVGLGVPAVLVGALIVGFGTSIPELVVSATAAARGELDIAMGNVVASNTTNVTLVLGAAAVVGAIAARTELIRREGLLMMAAVIALAFALGNGNVGRWEGVALVVAMVVAIGLLLRWSMGPGSLVAAVDGDRHVAMTGARMAREVALALVALVATVGSAQILLDGLLGIGDRLAWSTVFLGLLAGVGTSFPELAAALAAARKGEGELILGNILGSNIFNSLGVAGIAAIVGPGALVALGWPLLATMVGVAMVAGWFALSGQHIVRWEGLALLLAFAIYAVITF
jgi:cation:H+ antiporter